MFFKVRGKHHSEWPALRGSTPKNSPTCMNGKHFHYCNSIKLNDCAF